MADIFLYLEEHWVEVVGAILGLLYLYFEYRAKMWVWPVGILMPIFYIVVYWDHHLYALMVMNLYYIGVCIYGWWRWYRDQTLTPEERGVLHLHHLGARLKIFAAVVGTFIITALLLSFFDGEFNQLEALISALSIVATALLTRKILELWILLILANLLSLLLYWELAMWPTLLLHIVYFMGSILGYLNWRRAWNIQQRYRKDRGE